MYKYKHPQNMTKIGGTFFPSLHPHLVFDSVLRTWFWDCPLLWLTCFGQWTSINVTYTETWKAFSTHPLAALGDHVKKPELSCWRKRHTRRRPDICQPSELCMRPSSIIQSPDSHRPMQESNRGQPSQPSPEEPPTNLQNHQLSMIHDIRATYVTYAHFQEPSKL